MRIFLGPCILLLTTTTLAAIPLFAQSASPAVTQGWPESQNCPIEFNGLRKGALVEPTGSKSRPPSYRLNLQFNNDDAARILEVRGTIHGLSSPLTQPSVGSNSITTSGSHKRKEGFHLTGTYTARGQLTWPVRIENVPVVSYINLSEIRMTDGTVWHPSATSICRVSWMKLQSN